MNRTVYIKAEQIARMVVRGEKLTRIAVEMGMSYDGLLRITRQPEYLAIEEEVRTGVKAQMDARLARRAQMENEVEDAVPEALGVLLEGVRKKRDLRAALEVLDRDPQKQFVKTAPKPVAPDDQPGAPDMSALAAAVKEADVTHQIMTSAKSIQTKAEA